jgi:hypothetical protein
MIDRVERLYGLRVQEHLPDFPDHLLRRHARRLASRPPSAAALIREPVRRTLVAEEEDPQLDKLRTALDRRIGEAQLPELILAVDAAFWPLHRSETSKLRAFALTSSRPPTYRIRGGE